MMTAPLDPATQASFDFERVLNQHGYSFQHAVVNESKNLWLSKGSSWCPEVSEFPVEAKGKAAHVDFVLQYQYEYGVGGLPRNTYLVAECKRANPKFSSWAFAKAPYTWLHA